MAGIQVADHLMMFVVVLSPVEIALYSLGKSGR